MSSYNNKNIHLLFGLTKNGGTDLYINDLLCREEFKKDKVYVIGYNLLFDQVDLLKLYKSNNIQRINLFSRIYKTFIFFNKLSSDSTIYLSNSILILILGIWNFLFFIKKLKFKYVWIAQGCEIYLKNNFNSFILKKLLLFFTYKHNVQILSSNIYLYNWFIRNRFQNVSKLEFNSLPIISINNLTVDNSRKYFLLFLLRREKCKGSFISDKILNEIYRCYNKKIIVIDFHCQYNKSKWKDEVCYFNQLDNVELLNLLSNTQYLVYTSFFEGYGMLIREAIEVGCIPIIGPDNIFYSSLNLPCVKTNSHSDYIDLIKSLHV